MQFTYLSLLLAATSAIAAPLQARQTANGPSTCGNNYYSADQLSQAAQAGYSDYASSTEAGSSDYPHQYKNYEGFTFPVSGPYEEFPILESGVYNGGSPGADRVIFNTQGQYAGSITHTGASGNNFVACSDTS